MQCCRVHCYLLHIKESHTADSTALDEASQHEIEKNLPPLSLILAGRSSVRFILTQHEHTISILTHVFALILCPKAIRHGIRETLRPHQTTTRLPQLWNMDEYE